ncbi:MAG: Golgi transport complex subunit 3, partial [Watsoniomyces obsoletus]
QIVAFDIEFVTPDISFDFSGVTSTFYELRDRGGLFNYRTWAKLFSSGGLLPRVVENMLDAKVELDGRLRNVINEFTRDFAEDMTAGLPSSGAAGKTGSGKDKPKTEDAVGSMRKKVETEVPILRAKLEQYLDDSRT